MSHKEVSSCKEIQQKLLQGGSVYKTIIVLADCENSSNTNCSSTLCNTMVMGISQVNAPVPVQNTPDHNVHKASVSINYFSIGIVNGSFSNILHGQHLKVQKQTLHLQEVNCSYFSRDIVEGTRAFGKTIHYYREFGFLLLNKYTIQIGQGAKKLLSLDMKTWVQKAHAVVKCTGQPNYKQARITVPSGLCINKWRMYLQHYDLKIVCEYNLDFR